MRFLKTKSLIITITVFILLIFLHSLDILNPVEKKIFLIFAPIQKYLYTTGLNAQNFLSGTGSKENTAQVELLKAQIRSLSVQNAQYKIIAEENILLKKELGFSREHAYTLIGARVIGIDSIQSSSLLILQIENNEYDEKDIEVDMPVISEDGILIGKIVKIKQNEIFMMPTTATRSAVATTVLNNSYTIGVGEGESNLGIKMRMIPQTEKIKQGELVVTSGLEVKMPKGLLIGTVSKVSHDPQTPFDIAYVTPLYNLKKLSKVLIIKAY